MRNTEKNTGNKKHFERIFQTIKDPWCFDEHYLAGKYRIEQTLKYLPYRKFDLILDIGCGNAYSTYLLSRHGFNVLGADISFSAVKRARTKFQGCNFCASDIEGLPFKPESFDLISCIEILDYYANSPVKEQILEHLKFILRGGGRIIFSVCVDHKKGYFRRRDFVNSISKHFKIVKVVPVTSNLTMFISRRLFFLPLIAQVKLHEIIMFLTRAIPQMTWHLVVYAEKEV